MSTLKRWFGSTMVASCWFGKVLGGGVLFFHLGGVLWFCLLARRIHDEDREKITLAELVADGVIVVLTQCIHQLLQVVTTILRRWLGRVLQSGDLISIVLGMVAPLELVVVFPTLFLHAAHVIGVVWGFSLTEDSSHHVFSISELYRDVKEVGGGFWLSTTELMNECLVSDAVSEWTHHIRVGGIRKLIPLLGEPLDVVLEAYSALLDALLEVLRAPRAFVVCTCPRNYP